MHLRLFVAVLVASILTFSSAFAIGSGSPLSIIDQGALPDGKTLNTRAIQQTIDSLSSAGGGTVIIPRGTFLTGAVFLKPGVNLHLEKDAVLLGSSNIDDYPRMMTRIEGQNRVWRPAMVNASWCDGLRITGEGTIRGGGKTFWDAFWARLREDKKTRNLDVERPRNMFVSDSKDVLVSGIAFRDSGFWNLHVYRCRGVHLEKLDIRTPPRAPSTDGIDLDSSQNVTVRDCFISVDDDDIALKGTKGPGAAGDKESPPAEHVRISGCTFALGHGVVTLGSEASEIRDVVVEDCWVVDAENNRNVLVRFKLRPDTPQHYSDISFRNIRVDYRGAIFGIESYSQYFDLKGEAPPVQLVENISLSGIKGSVSGFGRIAGPPNCTIRNVVLKDIDLQLKDPDLSVRRGSGLLYRNVIINGSPYDGSRSSPSPMPPNRQQVIAAMLLANDYFMKKWPDPSLEIKAKKTWPSNIWTRAVYYEGLMALCKVHPEARYLDYARRWADSHGWGLPGGPTTRNADNQCCGQTYLELHQAGWNPEGIRDIRASVDAMVDSVKTDDWSWVDAIQMAMPVFAKLGVLTGDNRYFEKMHALFSFTKNSHGGSGLYNPQDHLWWRDKDFVPPYRTLSGRNCYWARGNGWVLAALVRALDVLPAGAPHREEYETIFKEMCGALAPLQRADGFWNVSLHDPKDFGGKELTGTALFSYGMAWGVNHGLLERDRFLPVITRAWNAMADDALHGDGRLGYVQGTGKEPKDGQPVTFDSVPDFEDYGLGCFLLAGSEICRMK